MAGPKWIREPGNGEKFERCFLLDMYKAYQDRQIGDFRLLFSYTNFYAAALLALLTAFVVALVKATEETLVSLLTLLPLAAHVLIWNGRITAWRFYRRYLEGRVRLTKIEYALGLDRELPVAGFQNREEDLLWPDDSSFLPARYFSQAREHPDSVNFINASSLKHGMGRLTHLMFRAFLLLAWGGLFAVPICQWFLGKPDRVIILSVRVSVAAGVIALLVGLYYCQEWKTMRREYKAGSRNNT